MSLRAAKASVFAMTSLNTLGSYFYFTYLFFLLRDRHGFDDRQNLWVAALHGAIYVLAAWQGGRFAERRGYVASLTVGFAGLAGCMIAGALVSSAIATLIVVACYTVVLLLIWPALEALTTDGEPAARVPHVVGLYNLTWSGAAAVAYFAGGPLYDRFGAHLVFTVPAVLFVAALGLVQWRVRQPALPLPHAAPAGPIAPATVDARPREAVFLRLGWMANPLAYTAIFTLIAVMPGLAAELGLTPTEVGLFCSIWMFARMAAFVVLWKWQGWHYRFRFLAGGYLLLTAGFAVVLLAPSLPVLVGGQVVFGAATGLMYYSSLFYSMDLGDRRAEHGGLHEAGVGLGILAGPALGATVLQLLPGSAAAAVAVTGLLAAGLVAMVHVRRTGAGR